MPITNTWLVLLFPMVLAVWVSCGVASGLYFLRRRVGLAEIKVILLLGLGSMLLAYSIVYQEALGIHLGMLGVLGATVSSLCVIFSGAIMWLRSGTRHKVN